MRNLSVLLLFAFWLTACGGGLFSPDTSPPSSQVVRPPAPEPATGSSAPEMSYSRPGLGTEWGETRDSQAREVDFRRASPNNPLASASLYYNNRAGIQAMTGNAGWLPLANPFWVGAWASVSLEDGAGRRLPGLTVNGKHYVVGEAGQRYEIVLENHTNSRLEAVLSVDGLDVLDGKSAGYNKRGYIVAPYATLRVDGFRRSLADVAAFRFSTVADSYAAQKYGDTRNVGVIGVALFHEYGSQPVFREQTLRQQADPFPGNREFATPPR